MQKIGITVLENWIQKKVTNKELDFLLYIARYQNEQGVAAGVYYKDVCESMGISYQGFYDCKRTLEEKEIIYCEKRSYFDWDITILGNSFKGKENYGRGYVNIHCGMVRSQGFQKCRAGAKLLALILLRNWKINLKKSGSRAFTILKDNFNGKYAKLFQVTPRILRGYLGELQEFLSIYLEEGRKYYITFREAAVSSGKTKHMARNENEELRMHDVIVSCRRNRIKEISEKIAGNLCQVLSQHHRQIESLLFYDLSSIVGRSLEVINTGRRNRQKWKRTLSVPLVHKILVEEIIHA